jgi:nitrogen fixation-related uncharacterized protein
MDLISIMQAKPVLIGLHLGFGIIGIDAFLWLLGKFYGHNDSRKSRIVTALIGALAFIGSWIAGGYYYVIYYGILVKPDIKESLAPWAHSIVMETKEHIFFFIIPIAITILFICFLKPEELEALGIKKESAWLSAGVAGLGLVIGAMGFIISAAARWG